MAFLKNKAGVIDAFNMVCSAELTEIVKRRNKHTTRPDTGSRFKLLEQIIAAPAADEPGQPAHDAFPAAERTDVFNGILEKLQDPVQSAAWQKYHASAQGQVIDPELIGLAFSGGGIRSSTFNLGILQALARVKLFQFVDYLSTVSGGGYLGSCISSLYTSLTEPKFPFRHQQGEVEPATFRHLRNNAEYLAPNGLFDVLRIPMLIFRGILIHLLIILPYITVAALVTAWLYDDLNALNHHFLYKPVTMLPAWYPGLFSWLTGATSWPWSRFVLFRISFSLLLLIFLLYPAAYLFLQKSAPWRWPWRDRVGRLLSWAAALLAGLAFLEFQPVAIQYMGAWINWVNDGGGATGFWNWLRENSILSALAGLTAIPALLAQWAGKQAPRLSTNFILTIIGICGVAGIWLLYLLLSYYCIGHNQSGNLYLWTGAGAIWLYALLFVDINHTSLHGFYRDRLSRAFLVKFAGTDSSGGLVHNDEQLLSELNTEDAPYHLINAAINLQELEEKYKQGRHAQSFIFSRCYVGSMATGFRTTETMESYSPSLNLGTAMAISGAAASPQMGRITHRILAFVLAIANIRLNYWLPNPKYCNERRWKSMPRSPLTRVGPVYLLWGEMIGDLNENDFNVNLSDGGHFENLGLYELLHRECRFIICGDGEADPALTFDGLANAIRMAQIDFGIKVEMDGLDQIRAGERNHAVGRIMYSHARVGWLLYLKSSLLGDNNLISTLNESAYESSPLRDDNRRYDDNPYIAQYKNEHPDFPHESTADQFFDEQQFEAYRALGYLIGMRALTR